jgi:CelD/BcsL family acetyltransferase involved in cellulose biosynthesis
VGRIFETEQRQDFAFGAAWFRNLIAHGLPPEATPCFAVLCRGSEPVAIVPLRQERRGGLGSLTNCYTCVYAPLIAGDAPVVETARLLGRELGRFCAAWPSVRLDALPQEWPGLDAFVAGVGEAGLRVRRFAGFGNWQEALHGRSWSAYLAARPGKLRELLRRKSRPAAPSGRIEFEIMRDSAGASRAVAAFEAVYARSWKPEEPHPRFNAGLIGEAARHGALRLAVASHAGLDIAAQLWVVANGRATVMKLAHDDAHAALSPGTLLTARVIEELIGDGVETIDFGRGDDPYKRMWAGERRQRIGLLLLNPRRLRGLATLARHDAGVVLRPLRPRPQSECVVS